MKRFLISTAAVALMSTTALAADLPVFEPAPPPPPEMIAPVPVATNWSGFYAGLHGGFGWADVGGELCDEDGGDDEFFDEDDDCDFFDSEVEGPVLGGQLGVNWQWDWLVFGLEGDASWASLDLDDDLDDFDDDDDDNDDVVDFLASFRGTAGLAVGRFKIYGTGGVGFVGTGDTFDFEEEDDDDIDMSWVAGGGADFLITDNVSLGVQYLHYDTDNNGLDGVDTITGRVNVKFNSFLGM